MTDLEAFEQAVAMCDPTRRVAALAAKASIGIAVGKAALAMARGAQVDRGVVVSHVPGEVEGWDVIVSSHPRPDTRSIDAARAVRALIDAATPSDRVLALISGGASALIEEPAIALADLVALIDALMDAGAPIEELNTVRSTLSKIKAGKLVENCPARVMTLISSDVIGDRVDIIGSGLSVGPWLSKPHVDVGAVDEARRTEALAILARRGIAAPQALQTPIASRVVDRDDRALVVLPMRAFAEAVHEVTGLPLVDKPYVGDVDAVADELARTTTPRVTWGEPTLHVPADHGIGGRAQQLALALAKRFRGTARTALIAGTDGIDGPPTIGRPSPAGAQIHGGTWDAIAAAGIDPQRALDRRDAGTALHAVGALVVTNATGVNHADVAILR